MDRPNQASLVLHRAADVARMLGCSEWWIKEQARNRRIPYSFIGGSYRFTDQHVVEIVRLFEVRPADSVDRAPRRAMPMATGDPIGAVVHLTARTPRRQRTAAHEAA